MTCFHRFARSLSPLLLVLAPGAFAQGSGGVTPKADFVFIIDATGSMAGEISAVQSGLSGFVAGLNSNQVDARFAIVLFGGAPELVLDFTATIADVQTAFSSISVGGAVSGFQNNHNVNPEASLEAVRIVLGASAEVLDTTHVGGSGVLDFRPDARKNLIVVTDEDSDRPFWPSNQQPGQAANEPPSTCPGLDQAWQDEVDLTASAAISEAAYVNLLVNPTDAPTPCQLGDPASDVADVDFLNFDQAATLANLIAAGYGDSLEGQVLAAGLIGRAFNIQDVNNPNFIDNFFAAKVEENNPFFYCPGVACPCGNDAISAIAGCANSTGDGALLASSGTLSVATDDLVLTMSQVPPDQFGLIYFGAGSELCAQWGDGLRGVQPGPPAAFMRFDVQNSGAAGAISAGPGLVAQAAATYGAMGQILGGSTWFFQGYYRDAAGGSPCGQRFNLSNALGVTFSN